MGRWWVHLDYSVSSGPFLTMNYEFDQDHGPRPGPELDNYQANLMNIFGNGNVFRARVGT